MFRNYFYLNRLIIELNPIVSGYSLFEAYSQEKDKLILSFSNGNNSNWAADILHLIISVSQNEPYVSLKKEFHRAKKNTIGFFQEYLPLQLSNIEIATDDRVIKFNFNGASLFFMIRGKDSNVIMTKDPNVYESFKKMAPEKEEFIISEVKEKLYSPYFHTPYLEEINDYINFKAKLKEKFPNISKEIINESYARTSSNSLLELKKNLTEAIDEIQNDNISVFYDNQLNKVVFAPVTFRIFSRQDNRIFFDYITALNEYLIAKYKYERIIALKSNISKYLFQQLDRFSHKLNQIKIKLDSPSNEEAYRNYGNLLLANIHSIKKGMKEIAVEDFFSGEQKIIKLNDTFDAKKNIDEYFEKAKNERQSKISLKELYNNLLEKYESLLEIKLIFESANKLDEYLVIMEKLNLNENTNSGSTHQDKEFNFKHYVVESKYHVYVGKDSHNNDLLTVKFAKQNDYWFHARGVPGSHVVLRVENTKEVVPKSVLKKTASIAAFHSKAKTSKMAPVAYTLKKYVSKKKGMEPGKVSLQREEVLLVPPEIPQGCEFQTD